jgi:hypothetical protein
MKNFSKSKLISMLQCQRRFWLELHKPELRADSHQTELKFKTGNQVGDVARQIFDPEGMGHLIDLKKEGFDQALARSAHLLAGEQPIFEAGWTGGGILAFADVMLPATPQRGWHMIEVKSSTSVKDYHRDDIAIQTFAARSAGIDIRSVSLAHIDSSWTYPGDFDYRGLFKLHDLTAESFSRQLEVESWVNQAQLVAKACAEPNVGMGAHCTSPFECGFITHCYEGLEAVEFPIQWLPRITTKKVEELQAAGIKDLREVPDRKLNELQQRVKEASVTGRAYFDAQGAAKDLAEHLLPCLFLDFESVQFGVPIWAGSRPYQQTCFQFSLHKLLADGILTHTEFIDLSGKDPSEPFAMSLIEACGASDSSIFVYNATFEKSRISELAEKFPAHASSLRQIHDRIVDLLPIARNRYYHPAQEGSWSIKKLLPALVPELQYSDLEGVQDGNMAIAAYLEAISPETGDERKQEIRQQLLRYCQLDTYSMVRIWQSFTGSNN